MADHTLPDNYFHDNGRPLSFDQRQSLRALVAKKEKEINATLKAREPVERNHWRRVIEESEQLGHRVPDRWRQQAERLDKELAEADAAAQRKRELDANPDVQRARSVAAEMVASAKTEDDADDAAMLIALADRPELHDEFWHLVGDVTDRRITESNERIAQLKQGADASISEFNQAANEQADLEAKRDEARRKSGGNDEQV